MFCKITRTNITEPEDSRLVTLPKSEQELNAFLQDMNINESNYYSCLISNVKTGNEVLDKWFEKGCAINVDELNHIAGQINKLNYEELDQLGYIIKSENPDNTVDFINILHNRKDYVIHENISDMNELGKEMAFRLYEFDEDSPIGMCVDYKQFGENYHDAHGGNFQDGKYTVPPSAPNAAYNGLDFPWKGDKNPNLLLSIYVTTYEKIEEFGDETPDGIWIELPVTKYTIDRTIHRLGAESIDDCYIYTQESNCLSLDDERIFAPNESLYEINTLAEVLAHLRDIGQLGKFNAALEYERGTLTELGDVIDLAINLHCYNYNPEITSAADYIIKFYNNDPVKIAQANELDGEKMMSMRGGRITGYGYVERNDLPMEQIYVPSEPQYEQDQGMNMNM